MKKTFFKFIHARSAAWVLSTVVSLVALPPAVHASSTAVNGDAVNFQRDWVVTPQAAFALIKQGALVIDARDATAKKKTPLAGAVSLDWQDLAEPNLPLKGLTLPIHVGTQKLQALGIASDRPIVVVADSVNGWGEDGRLTWQLRNWGHQQVVLADGGVAALENMGPLNIKSAVLPGNFIAHDHAPFGITKEEVQAKLGRQDVVFLDTREPREYEGKTPYGESRGGHLPPAMPLFFKDLLDKNGRLLPRNDIEKVLASRGVTRDKEVVSYCTAGIRSGWMTTVLIDMGYTARNYAGSMWEWSALPATDYPLQK